ncbi:MAG: hypothetical protein ABIH34_04815 [Nanoarchaeota archaeon]
MAIHITEEEMKLVREGKLDPATIMQNRKENPVKEVPQGELEKVKQEIREANIFYQQSIQKNKDLYDELAANRKKKEEWRNKIAELRKRKKELLGIQ